MKIIRLLAGATLVAVAGVATAQGPGPRPDRAADVTRQQIIERVDQRFARLDGNDDGRFTPEEARALGEQRRSERAGRMFERLDVDRNGSISRAEFDRARSNRAERRAEGGTHRRSPGMRGPRGMRGGMGRGMRGGRMFGEQGFVTREQLRERALARFERADADRNGTVTATERREARQHMRHRRGPGGRDGAED